MASIPLSSVVAIQQNEYAARTFIDFCAAVGNILFPVATLTVIVYDYGEQYASLCVSSLLVNSDVLSPYILG